MKIRELLSGFEYIKLAGSEEGEVSSVEYDSRNVGPGACFVAVRGFTSDGHDYARKAAQSGASLIVIDGSQSILSADDINKISEDTGACFIAVEDSRKASAYIPRRFYGSPDVGMDLIGVTGTKGKTTVTFMLHDIWIRSGRGCGLIGTVFDIVGDERIHAKHTTPEARDNYDLLYRMRGEAEADACVMEVSSQGLKLDRVYGMEFDVGCFTNLYEDHIGGNEHPDMEDYISCKLKLFEQAKKAVINSDCEIYERVRKKAEDCGCEVFTYGLKEDSDVYAHDIKSVTRGGRKGSSFILESPWYSGEIFVGLPGKFNVYNALCAFTAAALSGIDTTSIIGSLGEISVPGRLQPVENDLGITILVDYAHNAASLENVLDTLHESSDGRVITVFGCGGDRSRTRRFEMGEVSGNKSDYTIITSDNPRTEDPQGIIDDIVTGMKKTCGNFETVVDRAEAILKAIEIASPGDTVLIAGKGHEDYQIFADRTIHFDDVQVAAEAASKIGSERK